MFDYLHEGSWMTILAAHTVLHQNREGGCNLQLTHKQIEHLQLDEYWKEGRGMGSNQAR